VNLLRVIFKAMSFNEEEQERVMDFFQETTQSTFEKVFKTLF